MKLWVGLENKKREGVVLNDPLYRIRPLKYWIIYINLDDIKRDAGFLRGVHGLYV